MVHCDVRCSGWLAGSFQGPWEIEVGNEWVSMLRAQILWALSTREEVIESNANVLRFHLMPPFHARHQGGVQEYVGQR